MSPIVGAILFTLILWWFSTGLILYLDGLAPHTFKTSMFGAAAVAVGALIVLAIASHDTSSGSAYLAFTCALLIWGWQEMAFLMGGVAGPRRSPCPVTTNPWKKFQFATEAILYHELALIACLLLIGAATWHQPNQVGAQAFLVLWVMRLSAKLNLFFGVRNHYAGFLPSHLGYLASYFGRRSLNLLFPVSVTAATWVAVVLWESTFASPVSGHEEAAGSLIATLLSLAVLEHWLLVLPLPVESLWRWAMGSRSDVGRRTN
jgi:putative photosynthetic complex assembly protein 2